MLKLTQYQKDRLADHIDCFFPDCTLCNDSGLWADGSICICESYAWVWLLEVANIPATATGAIALEQEKFYNYASQFFNLSDEAVKKIFKQIWLDPDEDVDKGNHD